MSVEIRVPTLGESLSEATVARWLKQAGQVVAVDEPLVELETDKVSLEVPAPAAGVLSEILIPEGTDVEVGAVIGRIEEGAAAAPAPAGEKPAAAPGGGSAPDREEAPAAAKAADGTAQMGPAARKLAEERGVDPAEVVPTGPKGNVTKGDVLAAAEGRTREHAPGASPGAEVRAVAPAPPAAVPDAAGPATAEPLIAPPAGIERESRVRMTRLRKRIAERLKEAQNTAAMLTTFNEVDMSAIMRLRATYQDGFVKKHGIKLGFMGFFVKASIEALRQYPAVNAEIDGDELVFKNHYDIGVAVSTEQGLVVPVVRDADAKTLAEIEKGIADLGKRSREGRLSMGDLSGGTFTITNGGIFGSLMSTPILNPPQSGILGMHKIQERPVVLPDGRIEARPMMYLALSYDHRIVDGRDAVSFLVRVKECLEDPQRMLIDA